MSASMKSPRRESSSLPIGVSSEIGNWADLAMKRSFSIVISMLSAISSSVGLRPNSWERVLVVFLMREMVS